MIDISIVIPVYNVEQYIQRCIESIVSQNFSGRYEIILVDDGSTDSSYHKAKSLQNKYNNTSIKIIQHSRNKKLSQARRTGFLEARGKYIWNVDSDDWIEAGSLQELYNITCSYDVDVILFNAHKCYTNGVEELLYSSEYKNGWYKENKTCKFQNFFNGGIVLKFIKRSLIDINFEIFNISINSGEDKLYGLELFLKTNNLYYTEKVYYNYYHNIDSISKTATQFELFQNSIHRYEHYVNILRKYPVKKTNEEFALEIYNIYILRILYLKLINRKFSKLYKNQLEKTSSNVNEILILTNSKYRIYLKDLSFANLLIKSIRQFGIIELSQKVINRVG